MQCSIYIATSLDGFIARADDRMDWLATVERPGEDYGYQRFFDTVDCVVIGRKTYETALTFASWPYEGKYCQVLTSQEDLVPQHGVELIMNDAHSIFDDLERREGQRVYIDGGTVIRQFLQAGVVTDMTLSVVPLLLGTGVRLFGDAKRDLPFELVASRSFPSGLVQSEYRYLGERVELEDE